MIEMNEGIQIILNRMKTNPEEFFDDGGKWKWIFKDVMREVMTETEKVAIHEQLKQVRRMEISAKAAATVLKMAENDERAEREAYQWGNAIAKLEGEKIQSGKPGKLILNPSQVEVLKKMGQI